MTKLEIEKEIKEQKECMLNDKFTNDMEWRSKGERIANHKRKIAELEKMLGKVITNKL